MRKLLSFLLALTMLSSLVPGAVISASAAEAVTVQAHYVGEVPVVDGKLSEGKWLLANQVGNTKFALVCSEDMLYIALRGSVSDTVVFNINSVPVTVDMSSGTATWGKLVVSDTAGTAELAISMARLGLTYEVGATCSITVTVGSDALSGTLVLAQSAIVIADDFDDISSKGYDSMLSADYAEQGENGTLHYMVSDAGNTGTGILQPSWKLNGQNFIDGSPATIRFTADFNELTIPALDPIHRAALTGVAVDVRGASWEQRYGFHTDADNNIYVTLYTGNSSTTKCVDTGLDLPAAGVDVRIEMAADRTSVVYINDKPLCEFAASAIKPSDSTKNTVYLINSTSYRSSSTRRNDALIYDLLITQPTPAPDLAANKLANSGEITLDGKVDEMLWDMSTRIGSSSMGMLCDEENLYIALRTQASSAELALNDMKISCKLTSSPTVAVGFTTGSQIAGGSGEYEISVPLARLALDGVTAGKRVPLSVSIGGVSKEFTMVVAAETISMATVAPYSPETTDVVSDATAYLDIDGIVLNGTITENQWYLTHKTAVISGANAPAANVGFLWCTDTLYIGAKLYSIATAQTITLKVGSATITADLAAGTASKGTLAQSARQLEWAIPLAELGLSCAVGTAADYALTFRNSDSASGIHGKLTLSGSSVVLGDVCDDLDAKQYIAFSTPASTTWEQGERAYDISTDPAMTGNEAFQMYTPLFFEGGAYEFAVDVTAIDLPNIVTTLGWRGLCFEIRQPKLQTRFNLRSDGRDNVMFEILYAGSDAVAVDTGVNLGERAQYKVVVSKELIPVLYVNDKQVATFPKLNRTEFTIVDDYPMPRIILQAVNTSRALNADGTLGGVNAQVHDILFTQPMYDDPANTLDSAIGAISETGLLNGNDPQNITSALSLTRRVGVPELDTYYDVVWSAVDAVTGKPVNCVNPTTGTIARGTKPVIFNMVATVTSDGVSVSRTFSPFQLLGQGGDSKVSIIYNDDNPRVGQVTGEQIDSYVYFDTDHNSLVYDQGSAKRFNRIVLRDGDDFSRTSLNDLGVFISNDGKAWTKITGFQLHQQGGVYTLYNLDETARYVKVHSYQDDLDRTGVTPSFYNNLSGMMSVSMDSSWLGADGAFAKTAAYAVKNTSADERKDYPVYIPVSELGAKTGEYRADCADFRFVLDGKLLAHWYDGSKGFYVRVPVIPAKGSVELTVLWGNAKAKNISDGEAVFEVTYGNVSLINLSAETALKNSGRAFAFPNGEMIVVAKGLNQSLALIRSTDGGRTFTPEVQVLAERSMFGNRAWGFGGYLYDEDINRLYLIAYTIRSTDAKDPDGRMVLLYTEDNGYTWSEPRPLSSDPATMQDVYPGYALYGPNDHIVENYGTSGIYALTYCDGLKLKDADGAGPNVDYVILYNTRKDDVGSCVAASVFSKDGGETWIASKDVIDMDAPAAFENGISETGFAQLDDGTLYIVARAQDPSNYYLYEAYSDDFGNTWRDVGPSPVISSNTSPVLTKYRDARLLMWAGNNALGGRSYRRLPMTLAISTDQYKNYDKSIDLTFGTSYDTLIDAGDRMTQPSLSFSPDGTEAFVCWTNLKQTVTVGFLVEEFDQMIYGTKGGFDDFETSSLKNEGWLRDFNDVISVTDEKALSGSRSMKIEAASSIPSYATRQVPSMKSGTVGVSLFVPGTNTNDILFELKSAYNFTYLHYTLAAFSVAPDGSVYVCTDSGKSKVGTVAPDTWNDFAVSFDVATGKGTVLINGKSAGSFELMDKGGMVTAVQVSASNKSASVGTCVFVDDFYAAEVTELALGTHIYPTFNDVSADAWYYDAVNFAQTNDIMSGYNASTFGPNDTLNRAMVVQVLYNKEGQPAVSGGHKFPDVAVDQWYNNAVTWGSARKVVSGYGDGRFGPNDKVTLEQVAVILWNYSGTPAGTGSAAALGTHSDWAANALSWAAGEGLFAGVPYTGLTAAATRAQTAQMLMNYLRK